MIEGRPGERCKKIVSFPSAAWQPGLGECPKFRLRFAWGGFRQECTASWSKGVAGASLCRALYNQKRREFTKGFAGHKLAVKPRACLARGSVETCKEELAGVSISWDGEGRFLCSSAPFKNAVEGPAFDSQIECSSEGPRYVLLTGCRQRACGVCGWSTSPSPSPSTRRRNRIWN
jgi:hypothetical protein